MKLCIVNRGEIDQNALFLLGASTKEGQDKIGFFGSGNKYAMATLLRLGVPFEIYSGTRRIEITTKGVDFRGERFDQIVVDGQVTSFTTRMGPSWELWYALREFYCNAIDEGGYSIWMGEDYSVQPCGGYTTICVDATPEVEQFWLNRERYFSQGRKALWTANTEFGTIHVLEGDGKARVFRKGICVYEQNRESTYWYDFEKLTINESRVAQYEYEIQQGIAAALIAAPSNEAASTCLSSCDGEKELFENSAHFDYVGHDTFSSAYSEVLKGRNIVRRSWVAHLPIEDIMGSVVLSDCLVSLMQKRLPNLSYQDKCNDGFTEVELTDEQRDLVDRAKAEVEAFPEMPKIDVLCGEFSSEGTMASYSQMDNKVRVSIDYLDEGYDELVATLIEESIHQIGYSDGSRSFDRFLISHWRDAERTRIAFKALRPLLLEVAAKAQ